MNKIVGTALVWSLNLSFVGLMCLLFILLECSRVANKD